MDSSMIGLTFREQLHESIALKSAILNNPEICAQVDRVSHSCIECLRNGDKILTAGNGGSAADAQHLAAELVSRFLIDRPGLAGIALTTDTSILTAIGNDYGYEKAFSRQIQAVGRPGDVFVGFSTSGKSANVIRAFEQAKDQGIYTIGLTGRSGGRMLGLCDECICIPSDSTPRIQEAHEIIIHSMCAVIEAVLFACE